MLFGFVLFAQLPDLLTITGMLIIGGACLLLALGESGKTA